jgi:uncharacterized protein (DUF302 family)
MGPSPKDRVNQALRGFQGIGDSMEMAETMSSRPDEHGIVRFESTHAAADTVQRLEEIVRARGLTVFARVRFSDDAHAAGLDMRFTEMLLFGNSKAGTPIMVASPTAAIDLPLKVVVAVDEVGKVWLSFNDPEYLQRRHRIPPELVRNISGVEAIVRAAAQ